MPGLTLPTFSQSDLASHDSSESCYVSLGAKVYDVTTFIQNHPGGDDLILEYGGKDIRNIMRDELSHDHSEAAYEILEEHHIGFVATDDIIKTAVKSDRPDQLLPLPVTRKGEQILEENGKHVYQATGMSSAEDLSVETDANSDYQKHRFLDLNRPLLMQVWNGGFSKDFYLEQVHRPRHYKGGESAPLFGNFLEPLSKTPWWVVPMVWVPPVIYGTSVAAEGLKNPFVTAAYWIFGLFFWTIVEYGLHRGLFHIDGYLPDNRVGITIHFVLHGIHHYLPMDKLRLVMPPTLFAALALPFWKFAHILLFHNWYAATAAYCGGVFGYICYDLTHYFLHHRTLPSYYRELKKYHLQHHFADYQNGFGVTSRFWDRIFGTELGYTKVIKST